MMTRYYGGPKKWEDWLLISKLKHGGSENERKGGQYHERFTGNKNKYLLEVDQS